MHKPQPHGNSTFHGPGGPTPLLQIHDATVVKNGTRVLDRISLAVREGEPNANDTHVQKNVLVVGAFPIVGSNGQLFV